MSEVKEVIDAERAVTVHEAGNLIELTTSLGNSNSGIRKLDKDHYKVLSTGDIKEYRHIKTKGDYENVKNVRRSMNKLRQLIAVNFDRPDLGNSALWLTLTYRKVQRDSNQLYVDFKVFMKKVRKVFGKNIRYISVVEPMGSTHGNSFHLHVLLRRDDVNRRLFIPCSWLAKAWGKGFVKVNRVRGNSKNKIARYLSAYLTNMDPSEFDETPEEQQKSKPAKRFIKGMRLRFYPVGMKIYRCSRRCDKARKYVTAKYQIRLRFKSGLKLVFAKKNIIEREGQSDFVIATEYYNVDNSMSVC